MKTAHYNHDDKMIDYIIKAGANLNLADKNGNTLLHNAAAFGDLTALRTFLRRKDINYSLENTNGKQPLDSAIDKNQFEGAQVLLIKFYLDCKEGLTNLLSKYQNDPKLLKINSDMEKTKIRLENSQDINDILAVRGSLNNIQKTLQEVNNSKQASENQPVLVPPPSLHKT